MSKILPKPTQLSTQPFKVGGTTIRPEEVRKNVKRGKSSKELAKILSEAVKNGTFSAE